MRIAVPTNDGTSISEHFGRSAAFLVFETENAQIKSREVRANAAQHQHEQALRGQPSRGKMARDSHAGILSNWRVLRSNLCGHGRGGPRKPSNPRESPR